MKFFISLLCACIIFGNASAQNQYNIIPQPKKLTEQSGVFSFKKNTSVVVTDDLFMPVANMLVSYCNNATGFAYAVRKAKSGSVSFVLNASIPQEGYQLNFHRYPEEVYR